MTASGLKLKERIDRQYRTETLRLRLGKLELPFTRVAEPDRILDEAVAKEDQRRTNPSPRADPPRVPYWAELWESAIALGQIVARADVAGKSVLDLGCGMGLAGAAAAAMGAHALLADLEPQALLLARLNTLPWRPRVRIRRVDWQQDRLGERFDLILGADILYEKEQFPFLDTFWRQHLAEGGLILLGEPGRQSGDAFPQWATKRGWNLEESVEPIAPPGKPVRIFKLTLK